VFKLPIDKGIGIASFDSMTIFYTAAKITIKTSKIGAISIIGCGVFLVKIFLELFIPQAPANIRRPNLLPQLQQR
jgi:hypothetical protein